MVTKGHIDQSFIKKGLTNFGNELPNLLDCMKKLF